MQKLPRSSNVFAACRLEWRPSCVPRLWLGALAGLVPCALMASAMPLALAFALSLPAFALAQWQRRQYCRAPSRVLLLRASGPLQVDEALFFDWRLLWRGPLVCVQWRAPGRRWQGLSFWPDTLPAPLRRELRLLLPADTAISAAAAMAT